MAKNFFQSADVGAVETLFAGPQTESVVTQEIFIKDGKTVVRGTLLKRDPATGVCEPVTTDEDEPWAVASEAVDATDEANPVKSVGYTKGGFNREALKFSDDGLTWQDFEVSCRKVGIYLHPIVKRVGV